MICIRYDLLMKPHRCLVEWNGCDVFLFDSGWRRDPQGHLAEEHADDRGPQPRGCTGHALLRDGDEPPGRHGESEAFMPPHLDLRNARFYDISPTTAQYNRHRVVLSHVGCHSGRHQTLFVRLWKKGQHFIIRLPFLGYFSSSTTHKHSEMFPMVAMVFDISAPARPLHTNWEKPKKKRGKGQDMFITKSWHYIQLIWHSDHIERHCPIPYGTLWSINSKIHRNQPHLSCSVFPVVSRPFIYHLFSPWYHWLSSAETPDTCLGLME